MTVKNMRTPFVEKLQYITPDGIVYDMQDPPERYIMFYEGDGIANADYDVRSGPFQHGKSVNSFRLSPRTIDMVIRHNGCSREDYYTQRIGLNDILRHSRTDDNNPQPGVLRRTFSDGRVRDLAVFLTKPPLYVWPSSWDSFSVQETLQFVAYNPIAYDPTDIINTQIDFSAPSSTITSLAFPFSAPFTFNVSSYVIVSKLFSIVYNGNWEEYPTILISGPGTALSITHNGTGDLISLPNYSIAVGEVVTISLAYGEKTIVNNFGESLLGYVSDTTSLTKFRLLPDPQLAGGVNSITASMQLATVAASVTFQYKNRYESV